MPAPKARPSLLPERLIARLWRNRDGRRPLRMEDGRWVRVLYPGRPNGGPGPDFRDALVQMEGSPPVRGDVEVHRQAAGWNHHGHHRDPRYNNVVLHVVLQATGGAANCRQDGQAVPVTDLHSEERSSPGRMGRAPLGATVSRLQRWRNLSWEQLGKLLDQAGEQRFRLKSAGYRAVLGQEDAEELLYHGILEALGYSRNRKPFQELAWRLPWHMIRDIDRAIPRRARGLALHRLLLSVAGLSGEPPVALDGAVSPLGNGWPRRIIPMEPSAWCFAGVRPMNQPHRRMAGAAELLARYLDTGFLGGFLPLARGKSITALCNALTVVDGRITHIGRGRALDMTVNVVLPLLHAWGLLKGDPALANSCLRLYQRAPRLAENEITREMAALLGLPGDSSGRGALRQQGLIHLYQAFLKEGLASWGRPRGVSAYGPTDGKAVTEGRVPYGVSFGTPRRLLLIPEDFPLRSRHACHGIRERCLLRAS